MADSASNQNKMINPKLRTAIMVEEAGIMGRPMATFSFLRVHLIPSNAA